LFNFTSLFSFDANLRLQSLAQKQVIAAILSELRKRSHEPFIEVFHAFKVLILLEGILAEVGLERGKMGWFF